MPYTVWSRNRLVGESDLHDVPGMPGMRMADFDPTPLGHSLLPLILGVSPAVKALYEVVEKTRDDIERRGGVPPVGEWPHGVRSTTEYADAMSIQDELESLSLELHDAAGNVVKTDWIHFQDGDRLSAMAREEMAAIDPDLVFDDDFEPWQPQPARYQLMVAMEGFENRMNREAAQRPKKK